MKLTGAKAIVKALEQENVKVIFGYPGAAICPFYDALPQSGIRHVLTRHEQGAVHAASGYARVTGKPGVCVATSGPGATNMITGIATAYMDSIPIVAITGQVETESIGKDVFQEVDITGATAPFCKHNYLVKNAEDLPRIIKEAFYIASTGRPGPVVIDIPIDVQTAEIEYNYPKKVDIRGYKPTYRGHSLQIKKAAEAISQAKKPVICAGGGIINANATPELLTLAEKCRIPVATTLMGIGSIPYNHELNMGMLGSHGVYAANYAVSNADLVLILGARVADRAVGKDARVLKTARIIHIDIDPAEIGKNIDVAIPIVGDIKQVLTQLLKVVTPGDVEEWNSTLSKVKKEKGIKLPEAGIQEGERAKLTMQNDKAQDGRSPDGILLTDKKQWVNPKYLMSILADKAGENAVITTEVGQNQIWAANYFKVRKPRTFISSGGMGTMGYGLPAAVGAKIGSANSKVICIAGDGSFQMSMQELGTIKQNRLGVKIIILNNRRLGMVRELQKQKYCGRYSEVFLDENPDFVKIAGAYGFAGERITTNAEIEGALERMFENDLPYLLECVVDPEESTL